jgi:hypothetical protein
MFNARMLIAAAVAIGAATPALADFGDKNPITVTMTGATPNGYPRVLVEGLNAIIRDTYPGSSISFKPNSPGGGVLAVATGQADFSATASGTEIGLANEGKPPFTKPLKGAFSFAMTLIQTQTIHFLMTKEWADANGIKSWNDIAKKKPKMRLAINRPDNPQVSIGGPYQMMIAHGFTIDDITKWGGSFVLGNSAIGLDAIKDGKADAFMNARFLPDALIRDIASKRDLLWIDDDAANVKKAADVFRNSVVMVTKGTYSFVDKDYPTIQQWISVVVSNKTSEETVYKVVKAISEGYERVQKIHGSLKTFTPQSMAMNRSDLPYHPGALRYYKEKGLVK